MVLRYSFNMREEAAAVEAAVAKVLDSKDIYRYIYIGGVEIRIGYDSLPYCLSVSC